MEARTKAVTKDLMGKLPQADRVYLEQMMLATYCSALRDDKNISETDKGNRIKAYNSEVRKTLYGQQGKPQTSSSSEKGRQQTPSPQSKQQRPKQNEELKHRWNAWRPNRAIVEKLREPVNEHTNADIIFFDPVHRFFGERLASALESAGWRVNFTKTAQGPRNPHHYEGVEVKGVNRYLVESVVSVLKESGINGVKSQIEITQLNPNDADYRNVRNRINLIIGYEE